MTEIQALPTVPERATAQARPTVMARPTVVHQPAPAGPGRITAERYVSQEWLAREADVLWPRTWLFAGLERDWQMIEFATEHFVAQGDRVVMLGRCAFRYKKTGKVVWTHKADSWRFAGGKAIEYFEFYDTAQVHAAVA